MEGGIFFSVVVVLWALFCLWQALARLTWTWDASASASPVLSLGTDLCHHTQQRMRLLKPEAVFCQFRAGRALMNSPGYQVNVTAKTPPSGLGQWEARRSQEGQGGKPNYFWVKLGCSAWREVVRSCVHVWGTRLECFEKKSQGAVDQICQTGVKGGVVSIAESWFHLNTETAPRDFPGQATLPDIGKIWT